MMIGTSIRHSAQVFAIINFIKVLKCMIKIKMIPGSANESMTCLINVYMYNVTTDYILIWSE